MGSGFSMQPNDPSAIYKEWLCKSEAIPLDSSATLPMTHQLLEKNGVCRARRQKMIRLRG